MAGISLSWRSRDVELDESRCGPMWLSTRCYSLVSRYMSCWKTILLEPQMAAPAGVDEHGLFRCRSAPFNSLQVMSVTPISRRLSPSPGRAARQPPRKVEWAGSQPPKICHGAQPWLHQYVVHKAPGCLLQPRRSVLPPSIPSFPVPHHTSELDRPFAIIVEVMIWRPCREGEDRGSDDLAHAARSDDARIGGEEKEKYGMKSARWD